MQYYFNFVIIKKKHKTKMKKNIIWILLILLVIPLACKKRFEDGPLISFRSVKARIEGTWKVDKFYINDADSTADFNNRLGCEIEFSKDVYNGDNYYIYLKNCNNNRIYIGFWDNPRGGEFGTTFLKDSTFTNGIGPIGSDRSQGTWTILRLTNKEFNLYDPCGGGWGALPYGTKYTINLKKQ
jgi:hypothetical protein